jgi:hypothetical protein
MEYILPIYFVWRIWSFTWILSTQVDTYVVRYGCDSALWNIRTKYTLGVTSKYISTPKITYRKIETSLLLLHSLLKLLNMGELITHDFV